MEETIIASKAAQFAFLRILQTLRTVSISIGIIRIYIEDDNDQSLINRMRSNLNHRGLTIN